ncbi:MAG: fasciclin domain-containing protein [Maribacter dokdonensis]|uniref:Uncaracterized surface protein containing fasciclin (FAS1) repeats n=1 Tax=Maribacter dokdonensis TaxID=320912 RepID=A0ABY0UWP7_9FLAO|nr:MULTISPECIES: fasciclin domain-containing protein [Maribacter]MDP2526619.1 fasciclin domain-containing protein [Maribacter dokdonensis]PHN94864.1 beta-Ig-H3/fasciclin [Maribacter sp. 6B07]SDT29388.1 Uncaracterized surface protein containing fasciclin (FAS1) repeats [Maribacter dokdonensis]
MKISNTIKLATLALTLGLTTSSFAQDGAMEMKKDKKMMKKEKMMMETKMVGGAEMYPNKNIIENAVNSKDHTTLVAAVKAAELVETLKGEGPFTVFAPTNEAFEKLPKGTVETLLMAENKAKLQSILTYHVVAGKVSAMDLMKMIKDGNGKAELTTVNGGTLTAMLKGKKVQLKDAAGNISTVTIADVNQSNGIIHVIDAVVLPGM